AAAREADSPRAEDVRASRAPRRRRDGLEEAAVPADGRECSAPPHRRIAGVAGRMRDDCVHCDGLTRSRLLHKAYAEAGRGLPAIGPGMPLPAGTGLPRRRFVIGGLGAALAVYGGSQLGLRAFEEGIAAAATGPAKPVFVSVFLEGGADGLSV